MNLDAMKHFLKHNNLEKFLWDFKYDSETEKRY